MNYIENITNALTPWWNTLIILCYVFGTALCLIAAYQAINSQQKHGGSAFVWTFITAVLLLNLPAFMNSVSMTLFNQASTQELSYTSNAPNVAEYITFAVRAVMLMGILGVFRGINFLRDTPQRAKDIPRAVTHCIGGTLAINIVQFLHAIGATAGGDIQSYIQIII